jgi:hypothetical protein
MFAPKSRSTPLEFAKGKPVVVLKPYFPDAVKITLVQAIANLCAAAQPHLPHTLALRLGHQANKLESTKSMLRRRREPTSAPNAKLPCTSRTKAFKTAVNLVSGISLTLFWRFHRVVIDIRVYITAVGRDIRFRQHWTLDAW